MNKVDFSQKDELVFEKLNNFGALGKRALFIFQHLFLREDFRKLVAEIRQKLDIPASGLEPKANTEHRKIVEEKFLDHGGFNGEIIFNTKIRLDSETSHLVDRYIEQSGIDSSVPNMDLAEGFIKSVIQEYIVFNDFLGFFKGSFALATVETYGDFKQDGDDRDPVELRFSIPISAKKEEVKDYFDTIWGNVEFARKEILSEKDRVRFRPRANFIRDLRILNKYIEIENLSVAQRKEKGISYIEIAVKRELEAEGFKDIPDEGTIRSIVSRLKNEIKDKSAFWQEIEEYELPEETENTKFDDF